jgi:hypothetical protein
MTQTCEFCKKTENLHTERCPNAGFPVCDTINDIGPDFQFITQPAIPQSMYMEFWVGQGCAYYVRNNNGTKEVFFLHCDSHGQYGDDTSDIPRYRAFIQGYNKHTDD